MRSSPRRGLLLPALALLLLLGVVPFVRAATSGRDSNVLAAREYLPITLKPEPMLNPTPTSNGGETADWLLSVNSYRQMASVPSVTENPEWSYGDWLHARYMVKNDYVGHDEDPNNPWYTIEGDIAAENGNVLAASNAMSDPEAINWWMQAPFHAVAIIDPALRQVGYGSYREADGGYEMAATLDIERGLDVVPSTVAFPLTYPSGNEVHLLDHQGQEWPDPLTSCPGYVRPTGPPVILQVGPGMGEAGNVTPAVTAHSFLRDGLPLEHCVFDESSYVNPDGQAQHVGRIVLDLRDAIVLMPRDPLLPDASYTASVTVNGDTHAWSFTTAPQARRIELGSQVQIR
ncbi:MAG: CAP domain-containing protein [Chloroflexota bacterium]|nr:CAP domain-containing protein [Chloroflexota bacterium]